MFVYCNLLVLLSTTVFSQNINKQIVNIADENLTVSITILKQRNIKKTISDLKVVTVNTFIMI